MVVVDVQGSDFSQRFYRARPTAVPVFSVAPIPQASSSPTGTPRANDARNRSLRSTREPSYGSPDCWSDSPSSKTWTSRERIKAATCLSLSRDGKFLAVGETGYAPRVLIFSLKDDSSDQPLVSISEHGFGVKAVSWSSDGRYLASLGTANDGFLFVWKIDPRTGSARMFQQNRCTSSVAGMIWLGSNLITFGTRHVKAWKVVDELQRPPSPAKRNLGADLNPHSSQKTLPGRNVLLGSFREATFTCALALDENHALLCSDGGDVCLLVDTSGHIKLSKVASLNFPITCCIQLNSTAHIGGRTGQLASISIEDAIECSGETVRLNHPGSLAIVAMGLVRDQLVTIASDRSIDIWKPKVLPGMTAEASTHTRLPGQNDPVLGVQSVSKRDGSVSGFLTWSGTGKVLLWDLDGLIQDSFDIGVADVYTGYETEPTNELCVVKTDAHGTILAGGDRVGMLRVLDCSTRAQLLETKAHASEVLHIAVHDGALGTFIATSGRDRTVQLFHRVTNGSFELLQTLDCPARITHLLLVPGQSADYQPKLVTCSVDRTIQTYEFVCKEQDPKALAAIQCRSIALKASPTSMVLGPEQKSLFVSQLDRTVCHFDIDTGQQLATFKCVDENGSETVVLDSLVFLLSENDEPSILLGLSNTDKSVRIYDANTGAFLDREWGHTESINGVALVDDESGTGARRVVSVGCDGTTMIWGLDLRDMPSRTPSPAKDAFFSTNRPPLRRVLSKAELAEFPRPGSSHSGRHSPPSKALRNRKSRSNLSSASASAKTPTVSSFHHHSSPSGSLAEESSSRRTSSAMSGGSATTDNSPSSRKLTRRPSMPALGSTAAPHQTMRKKSAINLRSSYGSGSLQTATEATSRQLRTYRKKLSSSEHITPEAMAELETELRLTSVALGEQADRNRQAVADKVISGLLDQYSEKLMKMLDEKLRMRVESHLDANGVLDGLLLPISRSDVNAGETRPRTAASSTNA